VPVWCCLTPWRHHVVPSQSMWCHLNPCGAILIRHVPRTFLVRLCCDFVLWLCVVTSGSGYEWTTWRRWQWCKWFVFCSRVKTSTSNYSTTTNITRWSLHSSAANTVLQQNKLRTFTETLLPSNRLASPQNDRFIFLICRSPRLLHFFLVSTTTVFTQSAMFTDRSMTSVCWPLYPH